MISILLKAASSFSTVFLSDDLLPHLYRVHPVKKGILELFIIVRNHLKPVTTFYIS